MPRATLSDPATVRPVQGVVAVVIWHRGRVALLKRSRLVHHDRGRWHCVTGYLPEDVDPAGHALEELFEETGLRVSDIGTFVAGASVPLTDDSGGLWIVHTFSCATTSRHLSLNWENDAYRWVRPQRLSRFAPVGWLDDVLRALRHR